MTEHFQKSCVEARTWCKKCFRYTMHKVSNGRPAGCLDCLAKSILRKLEQQELEKVEFLARQMNLFPE
jgi:ribosomal protein L44E